MLQHTLPPSSHTTPAIWSWQFTPTHRTSPNRTSGVAPADIFHVKNSADPPNNGAVLTVYQIIKAIMSSAAEAELGAIFINCRKAIHARHTLIEMGHPQPLMPVKMDNTTALGVVKNTIAPRRTKAMDMRFHWLCDCIQQRQFWHYWMPGTHNKGDYVKNHHATIHHMARQTTYLTPRTILDALRRMRARARFSDPLQGCARHTN